MVQIEIRDEGRKGGKLKENKEEMEREGKIEHVWSILHI